MTPSTAAVCNPKWGKPYGDVPFLLPDGRRVWMYRKGQKVRFFTADGEQVGPEQPNVAPATAFAHSQGWVQLWDNPAEIKARLLDFNPKPLIILPVIKRGMVPTLILGQYGRAAVYTYRRWELEVKPSRTHKLPWEVTAVAMRQPPVMEHAFATTFDGAVCAGKILVDLVYTRGRLTYDTETALINVWQHVYGLATNTAVAGYLPRRDVIAMQLELDLKRGRAGKGIGPKTAAWFDNLSLYQRVALIDDRLELLYCMYGTNLSAWP